MYRFESIPMIRYKRTFGEYWKSVTREIPRELGSLANLVSLRLNDNDLSGTILRELGSLTYLRTLWLGENQLTRPIPLDLGGLSRIMVLRLDNHQLSGDIPPELVPSPYWCVRRNSGAKEKGMDYSASANLI